MPLLPSLIQVPARTGVDRALRDLHHIPVIRPGLGRLWARAAEALWRPRPAAVPDSLATASGRFCYSLGTHDTIEAGVVGAAPGCDVFHHDTSRAQVYPRAHV